MGLNLCLEIPDQLKAFPNLWLLTTLPSLMDILVALPPLFGSRLDQVCYWGHT